MIETTTSDELLETQSLEPGRDTGHATGWSQTKEQEHSRAKDTIANTFAKHVFLVEEGKSPETDPRRADATIFVAPGTTPNRVLKGCLNWISDNVTVTGGAERGKDADRPHKTPPIHITWYTGGALVAASLQEFREKHTGLRPAASVHLLPGTVDSDVECVLGPAAVNYVTTTLKHCFSAMFLSAYSVDLASGHVFFHFDNEVEFQRACAQLPAQQKFLFLDSTKLRRDGCITYNFAQLFDDCTSVTLYIGLTETGDVKAVIKRITDDLEKLVQSETMKKVRGRLRLCIVSLDEQTLLDKDMPLPLTATAEPGPRVEDSGKGRETARIGRIA